MATAHTTKSKQTKENDDSKASTGVTPSDRHLQSSETDNPALIHRPFVLMEELLEKLKLVNYDVDFCRAFHCKPISRCSSYCFLWDSWDVLSLLSLWVMTQPWCTINQSAETRQNHRHMNPLCRMCLTIEIINYIILLMYIQQCSPSICHTDVWCQNRPVGYGTQ